MTAAGSSRRTSALPLVAVALSLAASRSARGDAEPAVAVSELPPLPELDASAASAALLVPSSEDDMVTGVAKREQSLGNVASAVTVISRDRLRRFGCRTVAEAIATAAGVHIVDDRLSTRVGIRGLQTIGDFNTRILVVIDGTSVTEAWSHLSGVGNDMPVSIDEIERIEVIRGPVSAIYGTNAFFGIINIVTRGAAAAGSSWGRLSVGEIAGGAAAAGFAMGTAEWQLRGAVSGALRRGEDLAFDGRQLDSDKDGGAQLQVALSGAYRGTFAQLRAYIADRTVPFAPYDSTYSDPYTQTNQQLLLDVGHATEWRGVQISARLFSNLFEFHDRASDAVDPALITIGRAQTFGAEVRAHRELLDRGLLGVTAGLEASHNGTSNLYFVEGEPRGPVDVRPFQLGGLYSEVSSQPTGWLDVTAGFRVDRHSKFGFGWSPRAAVLLSDGDRYGLKLLYATGFRYPSTYEAYFEDGQDVVRNEALRPESIGSVEAIGWARPTATTWLRISAFRWRAEDVIKQEVSGQMLQFQNLETYGSSGVEVEASTRDRLGWYAFAGAALVQTSFAVKGEDTGGARPPGAPRLTATLGLSSRKLRDLFHLSTEVSLVGERPTRDAERTAGRFVAWNAAAYLPQLSGFDITVGVRNVLGTAQAVPAAEDFDRDVPETSESRVVALVPGEGREFYLRIGHGL